MPPGFYSLDRVLSGFLWRVFLIKIQLFRSFLRFDIRIFQSQHSFLKFVIRLSRLTFVLFFDWTFLFCFSSLTFSLFNWTFVFQLWLSFYSIEHSFFNFDVRFIPFNIFLIWQLYFKFDIWIINSSNRFSTLTFVLQFQHSLFVQLKILNVDKTASKWLKNKRCSE